MSKNIIKTTAILSPIFEQTSGRLVTVSVLRTRDLKSFFVGLFQGRELPRGTCISCLYIGNDNVPFIEIKRYGSATWRNLESRINQIFEFEQKADAEPEVLELVSQEVTE